MKNILCKIGIHDFINYKTQVTRQTPKGQTISSVMRRGRRCIKCNKTEELHPRLYRWLDVN